MRTGSTKMEDFMQPNAVVRFMAQIYPEPNSGCWLWDGYVGRAGYGVFRLNGVDARAHRLSYHMHMGRFDPSLVVRHKCDVPACVNPDHLCIGTHADNVRDKVDRGRAPRGESHVNSKLTDSQVDEVRAMLSRGVRQKDIAAMFDVTQAAISSIHIGRTRATKAGRRRWHA